MPGPKLATKTRLTRQRIVTAAHNAVVDHGHERLALRALARDLGVTAPALYDHFASRDDMLRAVAADGYGRLVARLASDHTSPVERLRARAIAYVDFAIENPELFRLMFLFRPGEVDQIDEHGQSIDNELAAASDAFAAGVTDLDAAVDAGQIAPRDTTELSVILWTAMHGVATFALGAPDVARSVVEQLIEILLRGLGPPEGHPLQTSP